MRETEKVSTGNEASQPIGVKHVATTCATPPVSHQCKTESQASKKKKKKREGHIYIHIKYLVTPNQSMCIRAKVNKPPHIPASVWGMDDPRNRGAADGPSQTTCIVQSHDQGWITPSGSSSQWWSSVQDEQCHPHPSSGRYRTFTLHPAVERTIHH